MALHVAIVSGDPEMRNAAARAMDHAPPDWDVSLHHGRPPGGADLVIAGADSDVACDLTFDATSAASLVDRATVALRNKASRCVVVTGPRGAGVTSVALHLAAVAARSRRTCFVDLDPEWTVATRVRAEEGPRWANPASIEDAAIPLPWAFRALVSPGDHDPQAAASVVSASLVRFQAVVVDLPHARDRRVGLEPDATVVVFPGTIEGAARAARVAEGLRSPAAFVVNRTGIGGESTGERLRAALGREIACELPPSPALRDAEDDSALVTSRLSPWLRAVARLARAVGLR